MILRYFQHAKAFFGINNSIKIKLEFTLLHPLSFWKKGEVMVCLQFCDFDFIDIHFCLLFLLGFVKICKLKQTE